jgi:hypothetical protein
VIRITAFLFDRFLRGTEHLVAVERGDLALQDFQFPLQRLARANFVPQQPIQLTDTERGLPAGVSIFPCNFRRSGRLLDFRRLRLCGGRLGPVTYHHADGNPENERQADGDKRGL